MQFQNPRNFIPIDAAGAFLTAFITAFLLATEVLQTGLPRSILLIMAAVAALYGIFGFTGFFVKLETVKILKTLAVLNVLYGVATISLCAIYRNDLTTIGLVYFSAESLILFSLAAFEWRVAHRENGSVASKDPN